MSILRRWTRSNDLLCQRRRLCRALRAAANHAERTSHNIGAMALFSALDGTYFTWIRLGEIQFLLQQGTPRCVLGAQPLGIKLPALTLLSYVRSPVPLPLSHPLDLHLTCERVSHTAHTPNGARYEDQDSTKNNPKCSSFRELRLRKVLGGSLET
jgi:hypothetical protein